MLEFAVQVKGIHKDGQSVWILAVDPTAGVLIAYDDKTLHWHPLEECTFVKAALPTSPRPVFAVQPAEPAQKPNPIMVPNRAARRELQRNGPA